MEYAPMPERKKDGRMDPDTEWCEKATGVCTTISYRIHLVVHNLLENSMPQHGSMFLGHAQLHHGVNSEVW